MKFIDSIQIRVQAGRGGNGIASFKSARGVAKLGADGGDGGTGGDVILLGSARHNTLSALRFRAIYRAEDGVRGGSNRCRGKTGEDLVIELPQGTEVYDAVTGELLGELLADGSSMVIAKGGRHGLGNTHWLSSTHQAPHEFRPGKPGEERELRLELKLLADVGLAGFPNAGKSTLLSRVSNATPKIADYPFTTLVPHLGVVLLDASDYAHETFVLADIPGLVEGASEGRGLGLQFLKHLERTSVVAFVLDPTDEARTPAAALEVLRHELRSFSPELSVKRALVVINKIDVLQDDELAALKATLEPSGFEVWAVSAVSGRGLKELKRRLYQLVTEEKAKLIEADVAAAEAAAALAAQLTGRRRPARDLPTDGHDHS